jgi:hypothetical protein
MGRYHAAVSDRRVNASALAAIPEPDVIFHGTVATSGAAPLAPTTVTWQVTPPTGPSVAGTTTIVQVGPQVFYVTRIPFETRTLAGGGALAPTAGTLDLPAMPTTFTRSAVVDGRSARFATGSSQFTYSAGQQGAAREPKNRARSTFSLLGRRGFGVGGLATSWLSPHPEYSPPRKRQ